MPALRVEEQQELQAQLQAVRLHQALDNAFTAVVVVRVTRTQ